MGEEPCRARLRGKRRSHEGSANAMRTRTTRTAKLGSASANMQDHHGDNRRHLQLLTGLGRLSRRQSPIPAQENTKTA